MTPVIRGATAEDLGILREIFCEVVEAGEFYAQDEALSREGFATYWLGRGGEQWVAVDPTGRVLGGYTVRRNYPGRGSHVATASYLVDSASRGRGIGLALGRHSLERARALGFTAIQFNLVVVSNESAVRLWNRLGFQVVGTLPRVFRHPRLGLVDAYVMHRFLAE